MHIPDICHFFTWAVKSVKIYTGQKKSTRTASVVSVTNIRYDSADQIEMIQTDLPQSYCGSTSSGLASSVISWLTSMLHKNDCTFKQLEDGCVKVFLPELLCIDLPCLVLVKIDNKTIK